MTKIFSGSNHRRKYRRKKNFFSSFFFIAIIAIVVLFAVNFADLASSLLLGRSSLLYGGNIRVTNSVMYGICLGQFRDKTEAENLAITIKNQGGAGYINQAGDYFVYAALYDSLGDAVSVKDKLKEDSIDAKIINVNIPTINFSYSGNRDLVINGINSFREIYLNLYETSVDYDGGKINASKAKENISLHLISIKNIYNNLSKIKGSNKITQLTDSLNQAIQIIEGLNSVQTSGFVFNSKLKETCFSIIFINIALAKQL